MQQRIKHAIQDVILINYQTTSMQPMNSICKCNYNASSQCLDSKRQSVDAITNDLYMQCLRQGIYLKTLWKHLEGI